MISIPSPAPASGRISPLNIPGAGAGFGASAGSGASLFQGSPASAAAFDFLFALGQTLIDFAPEAGTFVPGSAGEGSAVLSAGQGKQTGGTKSDGSSELTDLESALAALFQGASPGEGKGQVNLTELEALSGDKIERLQAALQQALQELRSPGVPEGIPAEGFQRTASKGAGRGAGADAAQLPALDAAGKNSNPVSNNNAQSPLAAQGAAATTVAQVLKALSNAPADPPASLSPELQSLVKTFNQLKSELQSIGGTAEGKAAEGLVVKDLTQRLAPELLPRVFRVQDLVAQVRRSLSGGEGAMNASATPAGAGAGANGSTAGAENVERVASLGAGASATQSDMALPIAPVETGLVFEARPEVSAAGRTGESPMVQQIKQVAEFLATHVEGSVKVYPDEIQAELKLYPPDLGRVRVQMSVTDASRVQAHFVAESPETAALLNDHLNQFKEALARHGLNVDRVKVTVAAQAVAEASADSEANLRDRQDPSQRRQAQSEQQRRQEERRESRQAHEAWQQLAG